MTTNESDFEEKPSELVQRLAPSAATTSRKGRPTKADTARVRRYNLAIWRLIHGKGSAIEEVSILTGLPKHSVKRRYQRVEYACNEQELNGDGGSLDADDRKYLALYYGRSKDPEVVEFINSLKFDPLNN